MPLEDSELAVKAAAGDREAFAELVRRHQAEVVRFCRALLQSDAEGDDAAQGVFLKVYQALAGFQGGAAFATWLRRIAHNHCLDLLRKRARERTSSLDGLRARHGEACERLFAHQTPPEEAAQRRQLAAALLEDLQPEWRLVLTLRELEGLNYEEISAKTGWTLDSVKARLRRARHALAEKARHFSSPPNV